MHHESIKALKMKIAMLARNPRLYSHRRLVEAAEELPEILQLDDDEPESPAAVWLAGSPRGRPVAVFKGELTQKFYAGSARSSCRIPFDHGDSGGEIISQSP